MRYALALLLAASLVGCFWAGRYVGRMDGPHIVTNNMYPPMEIPTPREDQDWFSFGELMFAYPKASYLSMHDLAIDDKPGLIEIHGNCPKEHP